LRRNNEKEKENKRIWIFYKYFTNIAIFYNSCISGDSGGWKMKEKITTIVVIVCLFLLVGFTYLQLTNIDYELWDIYAKLDNIQEQNYQNIQAGHTDVEYSLSNGNLKVYDVQECNELWGNSMQPTIFEGNTICEIGYDPDEHELESGMIVSYLDGYGDYVVHRIAAVYPGYYLIESDRYGDWEYVYEEDIETIVVAVLFT
jgi:hypothetical protein